MQGSYMFFTGVGFFFIIIFFIFIIFFDFFDDDDDDDAGTATMNSSRSRRLEVAMKWLKPNMINFLMRVQMMVCTTEYYNLIAYCPKLMYSSSNRRVFL